MSPILIPQRHIWSTKIFHYFFINSLPNAKSSCIIIVNNVPLGLETKSESYNTICERSSIFVMGPLPPMKERSLNISLLFVSEVRNIYALTSPWLARFRVSTHCGLVTPYVSDKDLGQHLAQVIACCLAAPSHHLDQYWIVIRKLQGNCLRPVSQAIPQPRNTKVSLKCTHSTFLSNLPGTNELNVCPGRRIPNPRCGVPLC